MHDPREVLEICDRATPGPWNHQHEHHGESVLCNDSNVVCFPYHFIDAQFIALAREALPEFAQRVIDLEQQRREDMELMEETIGAQKMALAAIEKYKAENAKLRAVAEVAQKIYRQYAIDGDDNIAEVSKALAAAGFGGESDG